MAKVKIFYKPKSLVAKDFEIPYLLESLMFIQMEEWFLFFHKHPELTTKCFQNEQAIKVADKKSWRAYNKIFNANEKGKKITRCMNKKYQRLKQLKRQQKSYTNNLNDYVESLIAQHNFDFIKELHNWGKFDEEVEKMSPIPQELDEQLKTIVYKQSNYDDNYHNDENINLMRRFVYHKHLYVEIDLDIEKMMTFFKHLPANFKYPKENLQLEFDFSCGHLGDCVWILCNCRQCQTEYYLGIDTRLGVYEDKGEFRWY